MQAVQINKQQTQNKRIYIKKHMRGWRSVLFQALFFSAFFMTIELFFHVTEKLEFSGRFIYPMIFAFPAGFLLAGVFSFFSNKVNCILSTLTSLFFVVWFSVQMCYSSVFMTYMELNKVTMAEDVANGFGTEMVDAIIANIPRILALILIAAVFSLSIFIYIRPKKRSPYLCLGAIAISLLLHLCCRGALLLGGSGEYSPNGMYNQHPRILDNNIQNFGVITSLRLELSDLFFGSAVNDDKPTFDTVNQDILFPGNNTTATTPPPSSSDFISGDDSESDTSYIPPEPVKTHNVLDIDYSKLIAGESNKDLLAIHNYVNSQTGTTVHDYTGYFEGYNLIMICAESFTKYFISPELTPTLYKMSTNGFVFNNFSGMYKSITTNGEYTFCTGLIPQTTGNVNELKQNSTFLLSSTKYLPYCMGNVFKSMGATTCAYHSNSSSYYKRGETHPNMGYELCRFANGSYVNGVFSKDNFLEFSTGKRVPNSDEETAIQTLNDYLSVKDENGNVKQFHAYYMTYSGHHPYYSIYDTEHTKSPMSYENRDIVDKLNYSEPVKSYIAASLEVENMVKAILDRLEEAGCLENTVIVLTSDHYPYGLTTNQFNELAGKKVDTTWGIYENSFICYNAGMETPVVVNTPCSTPDILPTLLNLFGVEYDSRLLGGSDILDPNSFHIAMLYNQSFITDKIKYNTAKDKVTYLVDQSEVPAGYLEACIAYVKNKFEISLQIIKNDYYKVIYDFIGANDNAETN